jgi:hypothetical protein
MQTILTTTASELTKAVGARYTRIAIAPAAEGNGSNSSNKGSK